jgi:hypothetical protein
VVHVRPEHRIGLVAVRCDGYEDVRRATAAEEGLIPRLDVDRIPHNDTQLEHVGGRWLDRDHRLGDRVPDERGTQS